MSAKTMVVTPLERRLVWSTNHRAQLVRHATAGYPLEVCGLLLGHALGDTVEVVALQPAANIHPAPQHHFELDPAAWFEAKAAAERAGLEVVGVWHSHPNAHPAPSAADTATAWPNTLQVIVAVDQRLAARVHAHWRGPVACHELAIAEVQA